MKVILTLILIIGVAYSVTIASDTSSNTWAITYTANSSNSSNTDIVLTLTHGAATLANSQQSVVACVNTGVANYTLSADTASLGTFIAQVTGASGTTDTLVAATNSIYGTTTDYTKSGTTWATTASIALTAPATVPAYTATTAALSFSAVTPTQLASMKLPNSTQTFYFRCFYAFKVTAVSYADAVADLNAGTTGSTNVTLKGSANRYIAIGATIASVFVASLM